MDAFFRGLFLGLLAFLSNPLVSKNLFEETPDLRREVEKMHLDFQSVEKELNHPQCTRDSIALFACVQGLQRALEIIDSRLTFIPITKAKKHSGDFVEKVGDLVLYRRPQNQKKIKTSASTNLESKKSQQTWAGYDRKNFPVMELINWTKKHLPKNISREKLSVYSFEILQETLKSGSDPHQYLRPTSLLKERQTAIGPAVVGVGIDIHTYRGISRIVNLQASPALNLAGIQEGQIVQAINGKSIKDMGDFSIKNKLRDVAGSTLVLQLIQQGRPINITLKRQQIVVPNVQAEIKSLGEKKYGMIKISDFESESTGHRVQEAIKYFESQKVDSIMLDLRNNGGGRMTEAVRVSNAFLPSKSAVLTIKTFATLESKAPSTETIFSEGPQLTHKPLVVLINSSSGSASEIVAGVLEFYNRALVVGDRSFGKGSFQSADNTAFSARLTKFKTRGMFFIADSQFSPQLHGIIPHIPINPNPEGPATTAEREEDLFNAIRSEARPLLPSFTNSVLKLKQCIKSQSSADIAKYRATLRRGLLPDYSRIVSETALRCIL